MRLAVPAAITAVLVVLVAGVGEGATSPMVAQGVLVEAVEVAAETLAGAELVAVVVAAGAA